MAGRRRDDARVPAAGAGDPRPLSIALERPLDQKTLIKKAAARAALAPANVISGAVALAASAALWNPLPLILWGLGSAGWVSFASTAERFHKLIAVEERQSA